MRTDAGPGPIQTALGELEDELATLQNDHAELTGWVKRRKTFIETYVATLMNMAAGDNVTERKENAKALLHESKEYIEYLDKLEELAELDRKFDYIDTRRSIGQSVLKSYENDYPRHGQEARGLSGTPDPG